MYQLYVIRCGTVIACALLRVNLAYYFTLRSQSHPWHKSCPPQTVGSLHRTAFTVVCILCLLFFLLLFFFYQPSVNTGGLVLFLRASLMGLWVCLSVRPTKWPNLLRLKIKMFHNALSFAPINYYGRKVKDQGQGCENAKIVSGRNAVANCSI